MSAYYARQRLPPPTQSFLEELAIPDAPPSRLRVPSITKDGSPLKKATSSSFLIFPEPTAVSSTAIKLKPQQPNPSSPTGSSSSLPTSFIASIAARRTESNAPSARSLSREPPESGSSTGDWEDLAPAPVPSPSRLKPTTHSHSPRSRGRLPSPLATLEEHAQRLESGWDWTLDREDPDVDLAMLLSWQRLAAASRSPSVDTGSRYVDAASQFHESLLDGDVASVAEEAHRDVKPLVDDTRVLLRRPLSFRRLTPSPCPTSTTTSAKSQPNSTVAATSTSFVTLPFSTLLQAIFSIDSATLDMLQDGNTPSLFGLTDDEKNLRREHQLDQVTRLLDSSNQATDRILIKGFRATDLMPTNPFVYPLYQLFNLGWTYGMKALQLSGGDPDGLDAEP